MKASKGWLWIGIINAVVVLIACAGLLWFTERFIDKKKKVTVLYQFNALNRWDMIPNQELHIEDYRISINSLGFRGRVPPPRKDSSTCRIMIMGGSSVYDPKVDEEKHWPRLLEAELKKTGFSTVETYNFGVPGYSSRETLALYHDRIRFLSPDWVLLYQGWNDVKYMRMFLDGVDTLRYFRVTPWKKHYRFLTEPFPWRNIYALGIIWDEIVDRVEGLRENTVDPRELMTGKSHEDLSEGISTKEGLIAAWKATPGVLYWTKNIEAFILEVQSDGAVPVLVAQTTLASDNNTSEIIDGIRLHWVHLDHRNLLALNEAMVEVLKELSGKYQVPFIDVREDINGRPEFFADAVHLKTEGSAMLAKVASKHLKPHLQTTTPPCVSRK